MMIVAFQRDALIDYLDLQSSDKRSANKVNQLILDMIRHPFEGIGKPEPLKHLPHACWSRRINEKDRLVYFVKDDAIVIIACGGHYDDR